MHKHKENYVNIKVILTYSFLIMDIKTKTYRESVVLNTGPHQVYEMFMDSARHSEMTSSQARISRDADGRFTVWDGDIHGKNLTLIPDKKIVQLWRAEGSAWPEGHFSTVTFTFEQIKKGAAGTKLTITHKDIPEEDFENVEQGWRDYYLQPLKEKFNKSQI